MIYTKETGVTILLNYLKQTYVYRSNDVVDRLRKLSVRSEVTERLLN